MRANGGLVEKIENLKILGMQMKMGKYDVDKGMSLEEKKMNYDVLKEASQMWL